MAKKSVPVLGRPLDALLVGAREVVETVIDTPRDTQELPLEALMPGQYQPRRQMKQAELEALAESIRRHGILQPILVRAKDKDRYEIIAGERRWRAARLAGLDQVPVIIKSVSDNETLAIALIENIQRENLNPLEEALALERLSVEFNLTHIQVAEAVGKSRSTVTNFLRLLSLNEDVKALLENGNLEMGHARALLGLRGAKQSEVAKRVIAGELSVRETEKLCGHPSESEEEPQVFRKAVDPNIRHLEESLAERLSARLQIVHGKEGKGKIVIHYHNLDELQGILAHIQ